MRGRWVCSSFGESLFVCRSLQGRFPHGASDFLLLTPWPLGPLLLDDGGTFLQVGRPRSFGDSKSRKYIRWIKFRPGNLNSKTHLLIFAIWLEPQASSQLWAPVVRYLSYTPNLYHSCVFRMFTTGKSSYSSTQHRNSGSSGSGKEACQSLYCWFFSRPLEVDLFSSEFQALSAERPRALSILHTKPEPLEFAPPLRSTYVYSGCLPVSPVTWILHFGNPGIASSGKKSVKKVYCWFFLFLFPLYVLNLIKLSPSSCSVFNVQRSASAKHLVFSASPALSNSIP